MEGKEFLQVPEILNKSGNDFVRSIRSLGQRKTQPFLRTSISRSYYAAFLHIRDEFKKYCKPKYIERHENLISLLQCSDYQDCSAIIGGPLDSLRDKRKEADYVMDRTVSLRESEAGYASAKYLIRDFGKIDIPKLLLNIKQKARPIYDAAVRPEFRI